VFLIFIATYDLFIKKQILAETEYKLIAETLKGMFEHPRHLKVSKKMFFNNIVSIQNKLANINTFIFQSPLNSLFELKVLMVPD